MMAQDNTKLCDFTNTNNNDFISTPVAPLTNAESCEINTALLNLVMKDLFSGLPSEDATTHLNSFVDLCDMQKKKDVDNDIVKLKLFPVATRPQTVQSLCSGVIPGSVMLTPYSTRRIYSIVAITHLLHRVSQKRIYYNKYGFKAI